MTHFHSTASSFCRNVLCRQAPVGPSCQRVSVSSLRARKGSSGIRRDSVASHESSVGLFGQQTCSQHPTGEQIGNGADGRDPEATAKPDFSLTLLLSPLNRQRPLFVFDSPGVAKRAEHTISFTSTLSSFPETMLRALSHNKEMPT